MNQIHKTKGYTLVELMITIGIIGVMASIAVPVYNGYISGSKSTIAKTNARLLSGFEDNYFYENGQYLAGVYDPSTGADTLGAALGWSPDGDDDKFRYEVTACSTGSIAQCYKIKVTFLDDTTIFEEFERKP